jgi:hypothetical protein
MVRTCSTNKHDHWRSTLTKGAAVLWRPNLLHTPALTASAAAAAALPDNLSV